MFCPDCGSEMVIRTARRGRNAGKQFYGCSNYPNCKGTAELASSDSHNFTQNPPPDTAFNNYSENTYINLPVFLRAREKSTNYQVRFYETIALPKIVLEDIYSEKISRKSITCLNQWRIDYPLKYDSILQDDLRQIYLVAHKVLTRGRITSTSPYIESSVTKILNYDNLSFNNASFIPLLTHNFINNDVTNYYLDGYGTEHKFFLDLMPKILGDNYQKYILPQVHLSSLIDDDSNVDDNRRIDFLITIKDKRLVVELDGGEHDAHIESDNVRNELLTKNGFEVFRIPNSEVQNNLGPNLQKLISSLSALSINQSSNLSNNSIYFFVIKLIHQIQITILEAVLSGFLDYKLNTNVFFDFTSVKLDNDLLDKILQIASSDLKEVINNLALIYTEQKIINSFKIHRMSKSESNGVLITFNTGSISNLPKFIIQDISFPFPIAQHDRPINYVVINNPNAQGLRYFLNYLFRHDDFLEGQLDAIKRTLKGEDSIVLLPTGAGKSVAFQLASIILPGVSIVIDPLIALIDDQLDNLSRVGIDRAVGITSQISDPKIKSKIINIFGQGEYLFCYIAPERFQTQEFRDTLKSLTVSTPVSVIVIDEAHCVSEWGHDFRTSYLNLGRVSREFCKYNDHVPPLLALTGTASNSVLRDVQRELQIDNFDSIITPKTFDRQELTFYVFTSPSDQKNEILKGLLQRELPQNFNQSAASFYQIRESHTHSGIVFCPHVNGSFGVEQNSQLIKKHTGIDSRYYSGSEPKNWNNTLNWNKYKKSTAKEFKINNFPLLVATKSFGMGIDKPNIRYIIHYGLPFSIESFYQEAGRAGRDRKKALCYVLLSNDFASRSHSLLEPGKRIEELNEIMHKERSWDDDDDITRAIYFHLKAFKGLNNELLDIKYVVETIQNISVARKVNSVFKKLDRGSAEKCIHRLLTIGVISDYTINYSSNEFSIRLSGNNRQEVINTYCRYVSGYNKGRVRIERDKIDRFIDEPYDLFIVRACKILIEFVYDTIEKGRRRALSEMLSLAESAQDKTPEESNQIIRERILKYLETSYSEEIEEILNEIGSFNSLKKIIEGEVVTDTGEIIGGIRSAKDVAEIRGQVARYLESYPDHPGLLFLRAITELYSPEFERSIIFQNLFAAINFSTDRYEISKSILYDTICWFLAIIYDNHVELYSEVVTNILYEINDMNFARSLLNYSDIPEDMLYQPGVILFSAYSQKINNSS